MKSCKIILIGNSNCGKTALCNQYIHSKFIEESQTTLGASFMQKKHNDIQIQLWDTAGQERFRSLISIYFRGTNIVLLTFSLHDKQSFDDCSVWLKICEQNNIPNNKILLIGCKSDLPHMISESDIKTFNDLHNIKYISCSSLQNINIHEIFTEAVEKFKLHSEIIDSYNKSKNIVNLNTQTSYSSYLWSIPKC
jgi:small GTP-binding protein